MKIHWLFLIIKIKGGILMSKIMRNGKKYGGTASSMAKDIIYDGTESGINAINVQGAIDEVNTKVDEQSKKIESCNFDILLSHKSAGTYTISDITKYRYLLLCGAYSNQKEFINSVQIPTEMFKSGYRMAVASTTNQYYCGVDYISDTEVKVITAGMNANFIGLY